MGIFNDTISDAQTAALSVIQVASNQFAQLSQAGNVGYNLIWNNPRATPQDILAALGTNAAAIFQLAALNITTVANASTIGGVTAPILPSIPDGWTISFNDDGSANVTAPDTIEVK